MNRAEFDKAHQAHMERQRLEKEKRRADTWGQANAPGPPQPTCDECGQPSSYARGDFGRLTDRPERYCVKHCPHDLRYAGRTFP